VPGKNRQKDLKRFILIKIGTKMISTALSVSQKTKDALCAQIGILNMYNPEGEEARMRNLYPLCNNLPLDPSQLAKAERYIAKYQKEIRSAKRKNPNPSFNKWQLSILQRDTRDLAHLLSKLGI
jgi:hypothetical protein